MFHFLGCGTPPVGHLPQSFRSAECRVTRVSRKLSQNSRHNPPSQRQLSVRCRLHIGYASVSTAKQDPARQLDALASAGISTERILSQIGLNAVQNGPAVVLGTMAFGGVYRTG